MYISIYSGIYLKICTNLKISFVSEEHYKHLRTGQQSSLAFSENSAALSSYQQAGSMDKETLSYRESIFRPEATRLGSLHELPQTLSSSSLKMGQASQDSCFDSIRCQYCLMQFSSRSLLNRHMKEQHSELPVSYPYNCAECGRGFFSQSGLNYHMDSHFVKSVCSLCGHTFKYSRNLKRHMEFIHLMKECRQCKCYISGNVFGAHVLKCTGQPVKKRNS